jgi:hypothetical protein
MIKIEKDKILIGDYDIFKDEISIYDIPKYLNDSISIGDDVTFKRVFDILIQNRNIFDIIFYKTLGGYPLSIYIDEYVKSDDNHESEISYLEIGHATEIFDYENQREVTHYHNFHGIVDNYTDEFHKKPCKMPMGIGFTPIYNFKKYNILINKNIEYTFFNSKTKKMRKIMKGIQDITLFDFYTAILYEISWHGTPENRDSVRNELDETCRQLANGELETYPMEFDENGKSYLLIDGKRKYFSDYLDSE